MKAFGLLLLLVFAASSFLHAQTKIVITSKQNISILKLVENGSKKEIPTWNKSGTGYIIEVSDLTSTKLLSEGMSVFKLSRPDNQASTRWIGLQEMQSMSIQDCFKKYGLAAGESESSNASVGTMFSGYSLTESNTLLRSGGTENDGEIFCTENAKTFLTPEEMVVKWSTAARITKITLVDKAKPYPPLWSATSYSDTLISYATIGSQLKSPLADGRNYLLSINLSSGRVQKYNFSIFPFRFITPQKRSFLVPDSLNIVWDSKVSAVDLMVTRPGSDSVLWNTKGYTQNRLTINECMDLFETPQNGVFRLVVNFPDKPLDAQEFEFEVVFKTPSDYELARSLMSE